MRKGKLVEEKGEFTIEATIVMIVTMAFFFMIMNISFFIYHMQIASSEANRVATDIAAVYGKPYKEPFYGYMDELYFMDCSPYRYWGTGLESKNTQKARWYACYYLSKNQFEQETSETKGTGYYSGVSATVGKNSIGQREITVKIYLEYPVFAMNPLGVFGIDPYYEVGGNGKAICIDPLHDMNCTKVYDEIYKKVSGFSTTTIIISNLCEIINKLVSIFS